MKTCFVICPIKKPDSDERLRSDKVLNHIIEPVISDLEYEKAQRADLAPRYDPAQTIEASIAVQIFKADLVIADLSDLNSNVLYELGKRHAWGKPCIHLTSDDPEILPFDIRNYHVIEYDLTDPDKVEKARTQLRREILSWHDQPPQVPWMLTPEDVTRLTRSTVVIEVAQGKRDHYYIAKELAERPCDAMFLMQRSSSLLLGPEQGWPAERSFYNALFQRITEPIEFYHIVSLEGLIRHKKRSSIFPETRPALERLTHAQVSGKDVVALENPAGTWYLKRVPEESRDPDLKPDRQARTFMIREPDGSVEGVVVIDLGGIQTSFHMRGPGMDGFFEACLRFYRTKCYPLAWAEVAEILPEAKG